MVDPNSPEIEVLYPAGTVPENRTAPVSPLCSLAMQRQAITGFLRQVLMQHFVDPSNISNPLIRKILTSSGPWRPSEQNEYQTGILIESVTKWQPNDTEKRPAVLIHGNDLDFHRLYVQDRVEGNELTGEEWFAGEWVGSHTLFVMAQQGAEAELLAAEVARFLVHYQLWIADELGLHRFIMVQLGALHQVEEVAEAYAAPITVAYTFEERWSHQPHVPRFQKFTLRASELLF